MTAPAAPRLTPRQNRILTFIRDHHAAVGYPPSVRQIAAHAGLASTATAQHHLRSLERKGVLRRDGGRARGLVVIDPIGAAA